MSIDQAIQTLYQARKKRICNPVGKFDNGGRWYPSPEENADNYIARLRSPSRTWPYSYLFGARTRRHIAALARVNPEFVLEQAEALHEEEK